MHGLTSLPPDQATAEVVLALVRGHWSIENRLHHVRDVSYDEDRCRVRTGHLPRNLACLTNLAISIVRLKGRFDSIPQAHRHYARRPQDAVRQLINPPKSLSPTRPRTLRAWPHHRANVPARPPCNPSCRFTLHTTPIDRDILLRAVPNLLFLRLPHHHNDANQSRAHPCTEQNFNLTGVLVPTEIAHHPFR